MKLNTDELRNTCKNYDITLIESTTLNPAAVLELSYGLEEFIWLCKNCGTSVIFYNALYYRKSDLYLDKETLSEITVPSVYENILTEKVKNWNSYLDSLDYNNAYKLILVAAIDGVVVYCKFTDNWLKYNDNGFELTINDSLTKRNILRLLCATLQHEYSDEKKQEVLIDLCEVLLANEGFIGANNRRTRTNCATNIIYDRTNKEYDYVECFKHLAFEHKEHHFDKYINQLTSKLYEEYKDVIKSYQLTLGERLPNKLKDEAVHEVMCYVQREW